MNKDFNQYIDDLLSDIDLPSETELAAETKAAKVSLRLKGIKHSEQTKKKWSELHTGKKMNKNHADKLHIGRKNSSFENLTNRISKEDILKSIEIHNNHQTKIIEELNTSFYTYLKLCKHYDIIPPKKSSKNKGEFAIKNQSRAIQVWIAKKNIKEEFYNEFKSVSECCRIMNLHKGNLLRNIKNKTPYNGYLFEYKHEI